MSISKEVKTNKIGRNFQAIIVDNIIEYLWFKNWKVEELCKKTLLSMTSHQRSCVTTISYFLFIPMAEEVKSHFSPFFFLYIKFSVFKYKKLAHGGNFLGISHLGPEQEFEPEPNNLLYIILNSILSSSLFQKKNTNTNINF